jgi:5,6-dimethylbenzimidazole synthase
VTQPQHAFSDAERAAVYRAIRERRDIRRFRPDPISEEVLERILRAGAAAPSVGYSQPWSFIVVRDGAVRARVHAAFERARAAEAAEFSAARRAQYDALKLEGIRESALNLCVACDRARFGPTVLGRTAQPETDLFSAVCAVQNLWLAARAEGIGVGWVSILRPEDLSEILELPEGVVPVAYLCAGYVDEFPAEPELKAAGWLPEIAMDEFVFLERWGTRRSRG